MNRTTGEPFGPRGVLHSLLSALTVNDAYNGLVPPSWAQIQNLNKAAKSEGQTNEETSGAENQYYMGY